MSSKGNAAEPGVLRFPLSRVKRIIKTDTEVKLISTDACVLIAKASEMFLEFLVKESYTRCRQNNRKVLQYDDIVKTVANLESLMFLDDVVPPRRKSAAGFFEKRGGSRAAPTTSPTAPTSGNNSTAPAHAGARPEEATNRNEVQPPSIVATSIAETSHLLQTSSTTQ
eukprot:CAMPEP_0177635132 /NCGR_PEP_ID=MMETSP0447-20121125/3739_1 /TAXON_ID=0 /ORGANISM="Stygamoeba regulata, Strain BSH-02190019" /LENGTH=167 /DNA_ID=CAMNT_0019136901 /DNA_START=27 /DNA_END=530 /DNA_ORIENTATION=-